MLLLKQLALAASAAAFLIVPETTETDEEAFKALPMDTYAADIPAHAMAQSLGLPCQGCKGRDTHLTMDFTVEDASRLTLNGYELYPNADPWHGDLTAAVVKANGHEKHQMLGYSLAVGPQAYDETQGLEIINVGLHVIEVGGRFIQGIPTVNVKLIKAKTGEILIGDISTKEVERPQCTNVWCSIKDGLDAAWKGLKAGCVKHKGHKNSGETKEYEGQRPHGQPAHPSLDSDYDWIKLLTNLVFSIILPVLTGIAAGVGVALFIMALCSCIAIPFRARRKRCRRAARAARQFKAHSSEPADEEEKTGLMDAIDEPIDAPPQYETRHA